MQSTSLQVAKHYPRPQAPGCSSGKSCAGAGEARGGNTDHAPGRPCGLQWSVCLEGDDSCPREPQSRRGRQEEHGNRDSGLSP